MTALIVCLANHRRAATTAVTLRSRPAVILPFVPKSAAALALRDEATTARTAAQSKAEAAMALVVAAKRRGAQSAEVAALTALWRRAKINAALASAAAGIASMRVA
jgi:hypothetical protein